MGNTPSAQHGSPSRPSTHVTSPPPSNPAPGPGPTNPSPSSGSNSTNSRHPNLRLPMPSRPTHISPQSSNPTSPSGRGGSPRRRKSLELPDLNKLSFTPAAPVPVTATTTNHLAVGTPTTGGNKRHSDSVIPASSTPSGRKWQHVLGGRASPLAGANTLGAMSRLASASPSEPKSAPVPTRISDPSTSPSKSTHETVNPYFPASPTRGKGSTAIPIPGKTEKDGMIPPPSTVAATPPSRDETLRADDGLVNVPVQWVGGGKVVYVTGNFADNWRGRIKLKRSTHDFNTILRLPPGQYRMKFIVDDSWRCSKQIPTATDDDGTLVNWIEVEPTKTEEELKAEWAMDSKPAAIKEDEDDSQWTNVIPAPLVAYQYIEELPLTMEPSDFDTFLRSIPYLSSVPQPPTLPRILDKVIVNAEPRRRGDEGPANAGGTGNQTPAGLDDNSILAVPNHVVLNHLTASAIKNGTLGVGTTTRYRKKYITTMFFKPSSADMQSETQGQSDGFPR